MQKWETWKQKCREEQLLCNAVESNDQEKLKEFIKLGYNINSQQTVTGATVLHEATENEHVEIAKILLDNKANPNISDCEGFTPLHIAVKKKNIELINLLVDHGAHALKDKRDLYPDHYIMRYYSAATPQNNIDKTKDTFAKKSHSALLYAHFAKSEKELTLDS